MTVVLGITGGIACGKSTVVSYLANQTIPVIDGDLIARQVVEPEQEGLLTLCETFGPEILLETGQLNRAFLGDLVFSDSIKRQQMNAILGPIIRKEILAQIKRYQEQQTPLILVDIPLLYESGYETYMSKVLVVWVSETTQVERLMKRNQLSQTDALARIHSQWPLDVKRARADFVIDNNGTIEQTYRQLDELMLQLSDLINEN